MFAFGELYVLVECSVMFSLFTKHGNLRVSSDIFVLFTT